MCIDRSCAAAAHELAARRADLSEKLDACERGEPDADPIAAIDAALALYATEAAIEAPLTSLALPA